MSDLRLKQKYPHKAVIIGVLISRARLFLLPAHEISVHEKPAHDISYNPLITHSHPILAPSDPVSLYMYTNKVTIVMFYEGMSLNISTSNKNIG